jgi:Angiotensin-converting enzyme
MEFPNESDRIQRGTKRNQSFKFLHLLAFDDLIQLQTLANIAAAAFEETTWKERFTQYEWEYFQDPQLKRQFQLHQVLGTAALPQDKLAEVNTLHVTWSLVLNLILLVITVQQSDYEHDQSVQCCQNLSL